MILDYHGTSLTTVEPVGSGMWRIVANHEDPLSAVEIELDVKVPSLDIRAARIRVKRDELGITADVAEFGERLVGVRVGQGMTKIVRGVIGGPDGSDRIAELTLDAMEMLINALTLPELKKAMETGGEAFPAETECLRVSLNDVVIGPQLARIMAENPRLRGSCIAFAEEWLAAKSTAP